MAWLFRNKIGANAAVPGDGFSGKQGTVTVVTTPIRSVAYSFRAQGGAVNSLEKDISGSEVNGPFYVRTYLRIAAAMNVRRGFLFVGNNSGTQIGAIALETDNTLKLFTASAQVGAASSALTADTWYRIEMYMFNNTVSGKMEIEGKLAAADDLSDTVFATTTTSTETGTFRYVRWGTQGAASGTEDLYFDDVAVRDDAYPGAELGTIKDIIGGGIVPFPR